VAANDRDRLPVWVITGFLGAGKTTLVNEVLTGSHGQRVAVLVNEFGQLGIDAALIDTAASSVVEVPNGCICCSSNGDLARGLDTLLAAAERVDGVLIETSGLAEPAAVAEVLDGAPFADRAYVEAVLTVVDTANFDANLDNAVVAYQQLAAADLLLLNKIDLVTPATVEAIAHNLSALNPSAGIIRCEYGAIPPELLPRNREIARAPAARDRRTCTHEPEIDSLARELTGPIDRAAFTAWTESLPANVWRVKGVLQFQPAGPWFSYQRVGSRDRLTPINAHRSIPLGRIVLIGTNLHSRDLTAELYPKEPRVYADVS
jgi:G3E family GTPase